MDTNRKQSLNDLFEKIAANLDIPESRKKEAKERYEAVGAWLGKENSPLASYSPEIYSQGSFRLGTVIKPISDEDEYDIDLVCLLDMKKYETTQKGLKNMVGNRLKQNADYRRLLDVEGRRCWTLNYAESAKFHMDILPAIPDTESPIDSVICITDRETWDTDPDWPRSNPKGYHEWFKSQMKVALFESRRFVAAERKVDIEEVPDSDVKTTLQKAIQILKRHRDQMFIDDLDDKPISIIITTLAAKAYNNAPELLDALKTIVVGMPDHIEDRNGEYWVPNPVNPSENFADKWKEYPERRTKFLAWLDQVKELISDALQHGELSVMGESMKKSLGSRVVNASLDALSVRAKPNTSSILTGLATAASYSPSRFNVKHKKTPEWPVKNRYKVKVSGSVVDAHGNYIPLQSDSSPLPKHQSLRFSAMTDVPWPFRVYWQVVNTGDEAAQANCLRGVFYSGEGNKGLRREESTLYKGMHWIECFIVKNWVCVARSGEFVVNIG